MNNDDELKSENNQNYQNNDSSVAPQPIYSPPSNEASPLFSTPEPVTVADTEPAPLVPKPATNPPVNNPGLIVLQWLTYAFWGWTVLSMSFLTVIVLANFIAGADDGSFTPYAVAAVLVLLPISVACDVFYSKQEPDKKTGAASIVMVIHAVLFAIFCIGTLIAIVISLVQLFTSSSDSTNTKVALYSEMIITLLYALVFLRTLRPVRLARFVRFFPIIMVIAVGIISVLGLVGPVAHARATRNDRLIDDNLSSVQQSVDDFVNSHHQLPSTLSSISLSGDAKKLEDNNAVQYISNSKPPAVTSDTSSSTTVNSQTGLPKTYYYELCVDYKKAKGNANNYGSSSSSGITDKDGYTTYISTSDHPAGKFCYKTSSTPFQ